jgi:FMN phosphatase YigB (HAD superfamily)
MKHKNIIFDLSGVLFELSSFHPHGISPLEEGIKLLKECAAHQANYSLFVCSNMKTYQMDHIHREYSDIMAHFKGIVTPMNAPARKPEPEIFKHLLTTYGLAPEESLLLDDQESNIKAVQSLGMSGIQVITFDQVRKELMLLGILKGTVGRTQSS